MTISTTENRKEYAGNDVTTSFAYPFKFFADTDLVVELVDTATNTSVLQVLSSNYTVIGAGLDAGGSVEMIVEPATGEQLVIYWDAAATQLTDYVENDSFPAESHEKALDKLTRLVQRIQDRLDRSVVLSDSDTSGVNLTIPEAALLDRALQFLQFDAAGNLTTGAVVGDIGSFVVSAANIVNAIVQRDGNGDFAANIITLLKTIGDVAAVDGTVVLDAGTDGTDATFTGDVAGFVNGLKSINVDIGDWDMVTNPTVTVTHGLADFTKVRKITAMVRNDSSSANSPFTELTPAGAPGASTTPQGSIGAVGATTVDLTRLTGGHFDNAAFSTTPFNRGWLTFEIVE